MVTAVGTQMRVAPEVGHLRALIADGYAGELLSTTLVGSGGQWRGATDAAHAYLFDANGATLLSIPLAHTLAGLCEVCPRAQRRATSPASMPADAGHPRGNAAGAKLRRRRGVARAGGCHRTVCRRNGLVRSLTGPLKTDEGEQRGEIVPVGSAHRRQIAVARLDRRQ